MHPTVHVTSHSKPMAAHESDVFGRIIPRFRRYAPPSCGKSFALSLHVRVLKNVLQRQCRRSIRSTKKSSAVGHCEKFWIQMKRLPLMGIVHAVTYLKLIGSLPFRSLREAIEQFLVNASEAAIAEDRYDVTRLCFFDDQIDDFGHSGKIPSGAAEVFDVLC